MKKTCLIVFAVALIFVSYGKMTRAQTDYTNNCTSSRINPYSILCSDSQTYENGRSVNFRLSQNKIPIMFGPKERPWKIVNGGGREIYTPPSEAPDQAPFPAFAFYDSWDQKDNKGRQVHRGTYFIVFRNSGYNTPALKIEVKSEDKRASSISRS